MGIPLPLRRDYVAPKLVDQIIGQDRTQMRRIELDEKAKGMGFLIILVLLMGKKQTLEGNIIYMYAISS